MNEVATRGTSVVAMPSIEKHLNCLAYDLVQQMLMLLLSWSIPVSRMLKKREIHHMHLMHVIKNHWSKTCRFPLFWTNIISILTPGVPPPWLSGATPHVIHFDLDRTGLSSRTNRVNRWWVRGHYLGSPSLVSRMWRFQEFQILDGMKLRWTSKSNPVSHQQQW